MVSLPHGMFYSRLRAHDACRTRTAPAALPRKVVERPGIGATAEISQRLELLARNITVDDLMLVKVVSGRKIIRSTSGEITADAGEFLLLPQGVYDSYNIPIGADGYLVEWIILDAELLRQEARHLPMENCPPIRARRVSLGGSAGFVAAFDGTREALRQKQTYSDAICRLRLVEVMAWLREAGIALPAPVVEFDQTVRTILRRDLSRTWTAREVADLTSTSEATLRRRLSRLGTSLSAIQTETRMTHALAMLQQTDEPVNMIALEVGYESASRFAIRFRQRFDCSPSEIRSGLVAGDAGPAPGRGKIDRIGTEFARFGTED